MYVTYGCIEKTNDSAFKRLHLADLRPELGVYAYRSIKKRISSCDILTRKSNRKLQLSHKYSLLPVLQVFIVAAATCSRPHPCDERMYQRVTIH